MTDVGGCCPVFGAGPVHVAPLTPGAADALCALATSLGLRCARIDLRGCLQKDDLLERIAAALEFPAWFGQNWDALLDSLADPGDPDVPGRVLVFEHAGELRGAQPEIFSTLVAVLGDAAAAWEARGASLRVFLGIDPVTE
jgi:RNAse (barnase) inhibitor barstar